MRTNNKKNKSAVNNNNVSKKSSEKSSKATKERNYRRQHKRFQTSDTWVTELNGNYKFLNYKY